MLQGCVSAFSHVPIPAEAAMKIVSRSTEVVHDALQGSRFAARHDIA